MRKSRNPTLPCSDIMKIDSAEIRIIKLQLLHPFETSFDVETERTIPLLTLYSQGLEGYAEGVMEPCRSTAKSSSPGRWRCSKKPFCQPSSARSCLPRRMCSTGWRLSAATAWPKPCSKWPFGPVGQSLNQPLYRLLGGNRQRIPVGASLGIQSSLEATREQCRNTSTRATSASVEDQTGLGRGPDPLYSREIPRS